ncbi:protein lethal(2)essential for life-like [Schistocerca serialis cubense]|uniref:protein lethal(2)essential for life-like n=1 Tax=Schistocerca serialis cubense TaxID=2023355 RepID=UPI00214E80EF|nr:protein lethal(2)essential for life-like [Schistocerca serialis cubense]
MLCLKHTWILQDIPSTDDGRAAQKEDYTRFATGHGGTSDIENTNNNFKVSLDVQQFQPNEISIKPVVDLVVVEEQHEEQQVEKCFISKQFTCCYKLPNRIEPEAITSGLSADSFLIIATPRKQLPSASMTPTGENVFYHSSLPSSIVSCTFVSVVHPLSGIKYELTEFC